MSRPRVRRRSRRRCSSTTSRPTCTRTTRRRPSGARRRCRSTATCCASCSARRSCASCSTPTRSPRSRRRCGRAPRNADELHDLLRLRGDLRAGEFDEAHAAVLEAERRAFRARIGGEERLIAAEDAGRYRDALGVDAADRPARRLPRGGRRVAAQLVLRYARGRGPFTTREANDAVRRRRRAVLRELEREEKLVRGELRPGGTEREWCEPDVLRRLRRASLAALRREVEPAEQAALGALPAGLARDRPARDAARGARPAAGAARCRCRSGSPRCCRGASAATGRSSSTSSARPARSCGSAPASTASRSTSARTRRRSGSRPRRRAPEGEAHDAIRAALDRRRASSGSTCSTRRRLDGETALPALWELVWAGEVTNDAWTPLRAGAPLQAPRAERRARRFSRPRRGERRRRRGAGRSRRGLFAGASPSAARSPSSCSSGRASSRATACAARGSPAATAPSTGSCARSRRSASCRRGYFVEGLGGAQFALGGAVERLRELRPREGEEPEPLVLAAADPAQPYGAALAVAEAGRRARRARRGRAGRAARRRGGAVRRARRPLARAAARARRGVAPRRRSPRSSRT